MLEADLLRCLTIFSKLLDQNAPRVVCHALRAMVNIFQQNNHTVEFDNDLVESMLEKVKIHTLSANKYIKEDASLTLLCLLENCSEQVSHMTLMELFEFIENISLSALDPNKEENYKFVSYTLFVLRQVCLILNSRVGFDDYQKERLIKVILKYDQNMWNSYHCSDSVTQTWSFTYSMLEPNFPGVDKLTVKILANIQLLLEKFIINGEDLHVHRFDQVVFDWKGSFKYCNKSWEENLVYFCNELLQEIWAKEWLIGDEVCMEIIEKVLMVLSESEYEPVFQNLIRETHLKFVISFAERLSFIPNSEKKNMVTGKFYEFLDQMMLYLHMNSMQKMETEEH